jgi:hypothetical protein
MTSKKIDLYMDFAAGVYQSLETVVNDTVSHIDIFNQALLTVAPLTFTLVSSPPFPV